MQDTILRVLVAVGLMMYPREELMTMDQDDNVSTVMQERQDWLAKEMERMDQEMTVIGQEAPEEDRDHASLETVQPGNINQPKANLHVAPTDLQDSQEALEEDPLKPTIVEEDSEEEEETKMAEVDEDARDSNLHLSPLGQVQSEYSLAIISPSFEEGPTSLDSVGHHSIEKIFSQEVEIHHDTPTVNQKVVSTNQEVLHTVETDPPKLLPLRKPCREDQIKVDENHLEIQENKAPQMLTEPSDKDNGRWKQVTEKENDYLWILLNTYSLISTIHLAIKYYRKKLQKNQNKDVPSERTNLMRRDKLSAEVLMPDSSTLNRLHETCVQLSPNERYRVAEFVEGLASDLLCAMRNLSDRAVGMVMEDFIMVEGMFRFQGCGIMVPIAPLDPYHLQFELWGSQSRNIQADMEGFGRIKMEKGVEKRNGCPCGNTDVDMLCLLHSDKVVDMGQQSSIRQFLSPTTPYLSKTQVLKWFQRELRQAWEYISHKYEFELIFSKASVPGAVNVRFRSGKVITFEIKPVVKFKDTAAYFIIGALNKTGNNCSDTFWELSLAPYEDNFLKALNRSLPKNSCHIKCLEIAVFLHRKQTGLTGKCGLTDYHIKTVLYHLLLIKEPSMWHPEQLTNRLQDLLAFLENCLQHKKLSHAFIGNSIASNTSLAQVLTEAKSVNLFLPLVVQKSLFFRIEMHFHELLKNMSVLIQEYASKE